MFILKGYEIGFRIIIGLSTSNWVSHMGLTKTMPKFCQISFPQVGEERLKVVVYCVTVVYKSLYVTTFFIVILQSLNHAYKHVCRKDYI